MNNPNNMPAMLAGYTVLDLSDSKAYTCGRFLASLGADVIKIEPPGGDPLRHSIDSADESSMSALWLANNVGKKSITLNLRHEKGRELFKQLVLKADFVIESFIPGYLTNLGLDYPCLKKIKPQIIVISISLFGQTGPYSQFVGGELVASAMGGTLDTCGYSDDTPVLEALEACTFHANAAASLGAMLAHRERGESGLGQHVDCSIQEASASRNTNNLLAYQFDQRKLKRSGNQVRFGVATVRVIWQLKDGYCFHSIMTGKFGEPANTALSQWMSDDGFENPMQNVDWDTYDRSSLPAEIRLTWEKSIDVFFKSKTKNCIATEGYQRGIRATIAQTAEEILEDDHLAAREFIQVVETPQAQPILYPHYFVRLSEGNYRLPAYIAEVGEHNAALYQSLLGISSEQLHEYVEQGVV